MSHVPLPARLPDLEPDEQASLKDWYNLGVRWKADGAHGRCGLWIVGPRRHGTSYIASCAMWRLDESGFDWEHVHALSLTNMLRRYWDQASLLRHNADDYGLFLDMSDTESTLEHLWYTCPALWVDDLHEDAVDIPFWRKHVQPHLERRIKDHLPTIVATTLRPDSTKLSGLQDVIEDLFVVCFASVPVRERIAKHHPYDADAER
jgi:hypothetical protein